jgi:hypothetical protein
MSSLKEKIMAEKKSEQESTGCPVGGFFEDQNPNFLST